MKIQDPDIVQVRLAVGGDGVAGHDTDAAFVLPRRMR